MNRNKVVYDDIVVVDVESTCWEKGKKPSDEESEIIEIGVCLLNIKSLKTHKKTQILIKPIKSAVSEYCSDLTGLTQANLDKKGITFEQGCKMLMEDFNSLNRVWASYGEYDRQMFKSQCEGFGIEYPFNQRHINVKVMLPIVFAKSKEIGMAKALRVAGLTMEGVHHCGADDAHNISRILSELIRGSAPYTP